MPYFPERREDSLRDRLVVAKTISPNPGQALPPNPRTTLAYLSIGIPASDRMIGFGAIVISTRMDDVNARGYAAMQKLLAERIVMIRATIDDDSTNVVIAQLLFLQHEAPDQPIMLWLTTPGGQVSAALAIYDTIRDLRCPVHTVARGEVAGIALLLLAAGQRGQRAALVDAHLRFTPIVSTVPAKASEMEHTRRTVARLLAEMTGKPEDVVAGDLRADRVLDAEEARAYGLIDVVVTPKRRA